VAPGAFVTGLLILLATPTFSAGDAPDWAIEQPEPAYIETVIELCVIPEGALDCLAEIVSWELDRASWATLSGWMDGKDAVVAKPPPAPVPLPPAWPLLAGAIGALLLWRKK
jgi:hypothetical protein